VARFRLVVAETSSDTLRTLDDYKDYEPSTGAGFRAKVLKVCRSIYLDMPFCVALSELCLQEAAGVVHTFVTYLRNDIAEKIGPACKKGAAIVSRTASYSRCSSKQLVGVRGRCYSCSNC
jgi:hypothetical protein